MPRPWSLAFHRQALAKRAAEQHALFGEESHRCLEYANNELDYNGSLLERRHCTVHMVQPHSHENGVRRPTADRFPCVVCAQLSKSDAPALAAVSLGPDGSVRVVESPVEEVKQRRKYVTRTWCRDVRRAAGVPPLPLGSDHYLCEEHLEEQLAWKLYLRFPIKVRDWLHRGACAHCAFECAGETSPLAADGIGLPLPLTPRLSSAQADELHGALGPMVAALLYPAGVSEEELAAAAAGNEVPVVRDVEEDGEERGAGAVGLPGLVSLPLRGRNWCYTCGCNPAVYLYKSRLQLGSERVLCPPCFVQLREQHRQGRPKAQGKPHSGGGDGDTDGNMNPSEMRLCCCLRPEQLLRLQLLVPRSAERPAPAAALAAAGQGTASLAVAGPVASGPAAAHEAAQLPPSRHPPPGQQQASQQEPGQQRVLEPHYQHHQRVSPEAAALRPAPYSDQEVREAMRQLEQRRMQREVSVGTGATAATTNEAALAVGGRASSSSRQTSPQPGRPVVGQPVSYAQELFQRSMLGQTYAAAAGAVGKEVGAGALASGMGANGSLLVHAPNAMNGSSLLQHTPHPASQLPCPQSQPAQRPVLGATAASANTACAAAPNGSCSGLASDTAAGLRVVATPLTPVHLSAEAAAVAARSTEPDCAATPMRPTAAAAATTATASPVQPSPGANAAAASTPARPELFPCTSAPEIASAMYNTRIVLPGRHVAEVLGLPSPPAPYNPLPKSQGKEWTDYSACCASVDYFCGALQRCAPHVNRAGERLVEEDYAYVVRKDLLARLPPTRRNQLLELCRDHNGRGGPLLFAGPMDSLQPGGEELLDDVLAAMARCSERIVETQPSAAAAAAAERKRRGAEAGQAPAAAPLAGRDGAAAGAAAGQGPTAGAEAGPGSGATGGPKKKPHHQPLDGEGAPLAGPFPWTMGSYEWSTRPEPVGPPPLMQQVHTPAPQHQHQHIAVPHIFANGGTAPHAGPVPTTSSMTGTAAACGGGVLGPRPPPEATRQRDHVYGPVQLCCFDMAHRYEFGLDTTPVSAAFKPFPKSNPPSSEEVDHAFPVTPPQLLRYMRGMLDKFGARHDERVRHVRRQCEHLRPPRPSGPSFVGGHEVRLSQAAAAVALAAVERQQQRRVQGPSAADSGGAGGAGKARSQQQQPVPVDKAELLARARDYSVPAKQAGALLAKMDAEAQRQQQLARARAGAAALGGGGAGAAAADGLGGSAGNMSLGKRPADTAALASREAGAKRGPGAWQLAAADVGGGEAGEEDEDEELDDIADVPHDDRVPVGLKVPVYPLTADDTLFMTSGDLMRLAHRMLITHGPPWLREVLYERHNDALDFGTCRPADGGLGVFGHFANILQRPMLALELATNSHVDRSQPATLMCFAAPFAVPADLDQQLQHLPRGMYSDRKHAVWLQARNMRDQWRLQHTNAAACARGAAANGTSAVAATSSAAARDALGGGSTQPVINTPCGADNPSRVSRRGSVWVIVPGCRLHQLANAFSKSNKKPWPRTHNGFFTTRYGYDLDRFISLCWKHNVPFHAIYHCEGDLLLPGMAAAHAVMPLHCASMKISQDFLIPSGPAVRLMWEIDALRQEHHLAWAQRRAKELKEPQPPRALATMSPAATAAAAAAAAAATTAAQARGRDRNKERGRAQTEGTAQGQVDSPGAAAVPADAEVAEVAETQMQPAATDAAVGAELAAADGAAANAQASPSCAAAAAGTGAGSAVQLVPDEAVLKAARDLPRQPLDPHRLSWGALKGRSNRQQGSPSHSSGSAAGGTATSGGKGGVCWTSAGAAALLRPPEPAADIQGCPRINITEVNRIFGETAAGAAGGLPQAQVGGEALAAAVITEAASIGSGAEMAPTEPAPAREVATSQPGTDAPGAVGGAGVIDLRPRCGAEERGATKLEDGAQADYKQLQGAASDAQATAAAPAVGELPRNVQVYGSAGGAADGAVPKVTGAVGAATAVAVAPVAVSWMQGLADSASEVPATEVLSADANEREGMTSAVEVSSAAAKAGAACLGTVGAGASSCAPRGAGACSGAAATTNAAAAGEALPSVLQPSCCSSQHQSEEPSSGAAGESLVLRLLHEAAGAGPVAHPQVEQVVLLEDDDQDGEQAQGVGPGLTPHTVPAPHAHQERQPDEHATDTPPLAGVAALQPPEAAAPHGLMSQEGQALVSTAAYLAAPVGVAAESELGCSPAACACGRADCEGANPSLHRRQAQPAADSQQAAGELMQEAQEATDASSPAVTPPVAAAFPEAVMQPQPYRTLRDMLGVYDDPEDDEDDAQDEGQSQDQPQADAQEASVKQQEVAPEQVAVLAAAEVPLQAAPFGHLALPQRQLSQEQSEQMAAGGIPVIQRDQEQVAEVEGAAAAAGASTALQPFENRQAAPANTTAVGAVGSEAAAMAWESGVGAGEGHEATGPCGSGEQSAGSLAEEEQHEEEASQVTEAREFGSKHPESTPAAAADGDPAAGTSAGVMGADGREVAASPLLRRASPPPAGQQLLLLPPPPPCTAQPLTALTSSSLHASAASQPVQEPTHLQGRGQGQQTLQHQAALMTTTQGLGMGEILNDIVLLGQLKARSAAAAAAGAGLGLKSMGAAASAPAVMDAAAQALDGMDRVLALPPPPGAAAASGADQLDGCKPQPQAHQIASSADCAAPGPEPPQALPPVHSRLPSADRQAARELMQTALSLFPSDSEMVVEVAHMARLTIKPSGGDASMLLPPLPLTEQRQPEWAPGSAWSADRGMQLPEEEWIKQYQRVVPSSTHLHLLPSDRTVAAPRLQPGRTGGPEPASGGISPHRRITRGQQQQAQQQMLGKKNKVAGGVTAGPQRELHAKGGGDDDRVEEDGEEQWHSEETEEDVPLNQLLKLQQRRGMQLNPLKAPAKKPTKAGAGGAIDTGAAAATAGGAGKVGTAVAPKAGGGDVPQPGGAKRSQPGSGAPAKKARTGGGGAAAGAVVAQPPVKDAYPVAALQRPGGRRALKDAAGGALEAGGIGGGGGGSGENELALSNARDSFLTQSVVVGLALAVSYTRCHQELLRRRGAATADAGP